MMDWLGTMGNLLGEFINWAVYDAFRKKRQVADKKPKVEVKLSGFIRKNNWPKIK
jgi:hypothetical protein